MQLLFDHARRVRLFQVFKDRRLAASLVHTHTHTCIRILITRFRDVRSSSSSSSCVRVIDYAREGDAFSHRIKFSTRLDDKHSPVALAVLYIESWRGSFGTACSL